MCLAFRGLGLRVYKAAEGPAKTTLLLKEACVGLHVSLQVSIRDCGFHASVFPATSST